MRPWQFFSTPYSTLHDPRLRQPSIYEISRRNTTAMGRATSAVRFIAALIFSGAMWSALGPTSSPWWWAVTGPAFAGSVLGILHTHQDLIEAMMRSRLAPLRLIGRELDLHGWQKVNLPAILETLGPLAFAWAAGAPSGPFAGQAGPQLLAAAAALLYSGLGTLHWIIESVFYQFEPTKSWSVGFARLARATVPALFAAVYAVLLARGAANTALPCLAAVFLLLYPAVVVYEKMLASALNEMRPAIVAQRLKDATIVHSSISNPLHYAVQAARGRSAADAEPLMVYLRGELQRCLDELDHQHPPATIGEIVEGVRASLLPDDRHRLTFASAPNGPTSSRRLGAMDASLARSVLADLCCNALKEVRDGHRPQARVTGTITENVITLCVSDDGPGISPTGPAARGSSLERLCQLLDQLQGSLTIQPSDDTGTSVTASWTLSGQEGTS